MLSLLRKGIIRVMTPATKATKGMVTRRGKDDNDDDFGDGGRMGPSLPGPAADADVTPAIAATTTDPTTDPTSATDPTTTTNDDDDDVTVRVLWEVLDRQLRVNLGASVRCGICLSTMDDPVRTPCNHAFCRDCLMASMQYSGRNIISCPECNTPIPSGRRAISDFPYLKDVADAYKDLLQAFGWVPGSYDEAFTTLTQKPPTTLGRNAHDDDDDDDDDGEDSDGALLERLCVATTWQTGALQPPPSSKSKSNSSSCSAHPTPVAAPPAVAVTTALQVEENRNVVRANWGAVEESGMDVPTMLRAAVSGGAPTAAAGADTSAPTAVSTVPVDPLSLPMPSLALALPGTQEVHERLREQEAADQEMHDDDDDADDDAEEEVEDNTAVGEEKGVYGGRAAVASPPSPSGEAMAGRRAAALGSEPAGAGAGGIVERRLGGDDDGGGGGGGTASAFGVSVVSSLPPFARPDGAGRGRRAHRNKSYSRRDRNSLDPAVTAVVPPAVAAVPPTDGGGGGSAIPPSPPPVCANWTPSSSSSSPSGTWDEGAFGPAPPESLAGPFETSVALSPIPYAASQHDVIGSPPGGCVGRRAPRPPDNVESGGGGGDDFVFSGDRSAGKGGAWETVAAAAPQAAVAGGDGGRGCSTRPSEDDDEEESSGGFVFRNRPNRGPSVGDGGRGRGVAAVSDGHDVTGMMEDSMGALHMCHRSVLLQETAVGRGGTATQGTADTGPTQSPVDGRTADPISNDGETFGSRSSSTGHADDVDRAGVGGTGGVPSIRRDDDVAEDQGFDSDKTQALVAADPEDEESDLTMEGGKSYDPRRASETTDETHASTKRALADFATRPAGHLRNATKPAKKKLFKDSHKSDAAVDTSKQPTLLSAKAEGGNTVGMLEAGKRTFPDDGKIGIGTEPRGKQDPPRTRNEGIVGSSEDPSRRATVADGPGVCAAPAPETSTLCEASKSWSVGTIVNVQARTWPGVNKHGGVGRISAVNEDGTYNISYVLGGKEPNVDAIFIEKEDQGDGDDDTSPKAASSRRKRRSADDARWSLPEELLRKLAEEGFDTGILVPSRKSTKRKKSSDALANSTNVRRHKSADKSGTGKQKAPPGTDPSASSREDTGNGRSTDTSEQQQSKSYKAGAKKRIVTAEKPTKFPRESTRSRSAANAETAVSPGRSTNSIETGTKRRRVTAVMSTKTLKDPCSDDKSAALTEKARSVPSLHKTADDGSDINTVCEYSNDEACRLADIWYRERFQTALREKTIYVLASNLSNEDTALLRSLNAKALAGNIRVKTTEAISKKTTVCVIPAEFREGNLLASSRTIKAMRSALLGIPIVTPEWLQRCVLEGMAVEPTSFIRSLPTKASEFEDSGQTRFGVAMLSAAWSSRPNGPALPFRDTFVFLCGAYTPDLRKYIIELLKEGGAKILPGPSDVSTMLKSYANSGRTSSKTVILCSDGGLSMPKSLETELKATLENREWKKSVSIVDSTWVFESITCAKALPPISFEPAGKKDLWELCL